MKPNLDFKPSGKIEKLLAELAKAGDELSDSEHGIIDIIIAFPETYSPLVKALFKNKYLAEHYDPEIIVELLHHAY